MTRAAAALVGAVFGFTLAWSGMADPDVIRRGLLLENSYLYVLFATALGTAALGLLVLRRLRVRALLTGEPVVASRERPDRRHIAGSVLFGTGWALAGACPGPILVQVAQGRPWALLALAGMTAGVVGGLRAERVRGREPALAAE